MAKISLTKNFPPTTTSVLEINEILRERDKVQFGLNFKTNLGSSQSWVGTGVTYNATLKVSGTGIETQTKTVQLKDSDEYWQGTATHTLDKLSWEVNVPSSANSVRIDVTYKYSDEATTMSGSTEITLTKLLNVLNPFSNNESLDLEQTQTLSITQYDSTFTSNLELIVKNNQNQNVTIATFKNVEDGQQISLNEMQLNALFNATSNQQKYQIFWLLYTLNNGTSIGNTTTQSIGVINNANPIFTDFDYQDINPITSALSNNVILGYSTLKVSIPTNKKAIAQKGASIVSYSVEDISLPYSLTQEVYTDPGLPNYNKNTLSVTAYDTRQNSTPVVKNLNVVNYVKLTADETQKSYERQNNVGTQTKITFGGTWWNDNFGLKDNALTVSYKYKIVGSTTWTQGGNITPIISGNNYSFDNYIRGDAPDNGFLVKNSYDLVVRVEDKLDYVEFVYQIIAGVPAMKIKGNKVLEINDILFENLLLPSGSVIEYAGDTAPNGWLICDGSAISRQKYSKLFEVIGTTYGSGDGDSTFNLPNLKGKIPVGLNSDDSDFNILGKTGGEKTHILKSNEMPSHNHRQTVTASRTGSGSTYVSWNANNLFGNTDTAARNTLNTGGGEAHNNLQPYIVLNYIIKY